MKELFESAYVGIPVPDCSLLDYLKTINPKQLYHISILLMGKIDDTKILKVRNAVSSHSEIISGIAVTPGKIVQYGPGLGIVGIKIQNPDQLKKLNTLLKRDLPEFSRSNRGYTAHITIENLKRPYLKAETREMILKEDANKQIEPFTPKSLSVFYRTEEGATALLFNKKL